MAFQQAAAWKQCARAVGAQPLDTGVAKNATFNVVPRSFIFQLKNLNLYIFYIVYKKLQEKYMERKDRFQSELGTVVLWQGHSPSTSFCHSRHTR